MKKRVLTTLTAAAILLAAVSSGAQERPQSSGRQYAHVLLTILTDPQANPMPAEEDQIKALLLPNENAAADAQTTSNRSAADGFELKLLDKPKDVNGVQITRLELVLTLDKKDKDAAKQHVETYVKNMQQTLDREYEKHRTLYQDKQTSYAEQVRQAELRFTQLVEQQRALPEGALDPESAQRRLQEQSNQLFENKLERVMLENRAAELSKYVDMAASAPPAPADTDASIRELTEQLRQTETQLQEGGYGENTYDAAVLRSRIIDAKILLAQRKSELADQAAAEIRQLDRQRHETLMRLQELAAQEKALASMPAVSMADSIQYEILEVKIQAAKEALHDALAEAEKFDAQMNTLQRPVVNYTDVSFSAEPQLARRAF